MSTNLDLEKAKILAAAQALAKAKVDELREHFDSEIQEIQPVPGPQGPQGEQGPKGERGPSGQDRKVVVEARGPVGEKGDTGHTFKDAKISDGQLHLIREDDEIITAGNVVGPRGGQGIPGKKGEQGEQGIQGERGFIGESGEVGPIGPRGLIGEQGKKGQRGQRGFIGEQGVPGIQGEKGEQGVQGERGLIGEQGEIGEQGFPGIQGIRGEIGPAGPEGPKGKDGTEVDTDFIKETLKNDYRGFQQQISEQVNRLAASASSFAGSGEVRLEFLDDINRDSVKVDGKFLKYDSSSGKWIGGDAGGADTTANTNAAISNLNTNLTATNTAIRLVDSQRLANTNSAISNLNTNLTATNTAIRLVDSQRLANTNSAISNLNTNLTATNTAIRLVDSQRLANTNAAISNLNTNLTATNTAIRLVDSQRLANTNAAISNLNTNLTGSNTAIRSYVDTEVAGIVDSAPETLNTLNELAAAINDDASYAAAVTTNLGQKLGATSTVTLTGDVTASSTAFSANAVSLTTTDTNLANTNAAISNLNTNLTATNTAIRLVDSQRLANTNAAISNLNTNLTATNTAIRLIDSQRLANTNTYIATKANHNNTTLTGTISANGSVGVAGYVLTSAGSGAPAFWDAVTGGGSDDDSTYVSKSNSAAQAIASGLSLNGANTNILGGTLLVTSNTKFHTGGVSFKGQALDVRFANTAQLANTNTYIASKLSSANVDQTSGASSITTTQKDVDLNDNALVNPNGYLEFDLGGTAYKVPYWT